MHGLIERLKRIDEDNNNNNNNKSFKKSYDES